MDTGALMELRQIDCFRGRRGTLRQRIRGEVKSGGILADQYGDPCQHPGSRHAGQCVVG